MKLGVIVRQDLTGLGVQTRAIARLLDADKVIVVDFESVNHNNQHPELLEGLTSNRVVIDGFIPINRLDEVLGGLDVLVSCEIDYSYSYQLVARAKQLGVKTIIVSNFEFCDWLQNPLLPRPDVIANHSIWRNDELEDALGVSVPVIETPTFTEKYEVIYHQNLAKTGTGKPRFLHVAGRKTAEDRNGTEDLLKAIKLIPEEVDFELVVKTQTTEVVCDDPRVVIDRDSPDDERELYRWFDAMILPRRYAGASLPAQEALSAGLPVIMTDIDPNNKILPVCWLVEAEKKAKLMARTKIDVYSADPTALAARIAQFAVLSDTTLNRYKKFAREIAEEKFSAKVIKHKWYRLLETLEV